MNKFGTLRELVATLAICILNQKDKKVCLNLYNSFRFREKIQRKWKRLLHKSHTSQVNYIAIVSLREEMDSVLAGSTSVSTLKWPVENTDNWHGSD